MKMNRTDTARVKKLNAEILRLRNEVADIEAPYEQQRAANYVGMCLRTRNNYSCPEKPSDYWWLYVKVLRADEHGALRCLRFEVDKDGAVRVEPNDFFMVQTLESYEPISPDEFTRQYAQMLKHLEKAHASR